MIVCEISHAGRFKSLSPAIAQALDWLEKHYGDSFEKGRIDISDDGSIYVNCQEPHLRDREVSELETHRRYIDIHVPLKNSETIGWAPLAGLKHPHGEYDADNDICFFGDSATSMLHVRKGQIAIFFPEDAHAPNIGVGTHRKLCIKIPVDDRTE
ncbi:MAG: YhcH/YjgK/YiaL family protein [Muribaculaceae bacterium]|nr:YhcH/YjgK/YiaL family protein [Muribaculaceae bacterium]MDE6704155.1 YhcH/YjgK/YiaL family protein [Muribaculaceae bacterium]